MKLRPILFFGSIVVAAALMLPTASSWIIRDFLHQTLQISGDFESASIDPFKGNLVLHGFVLNEICNAGSTTTGHGGTTTRDEIDRPTSSGLYINKIDKIWANYSLSQILYRRLHASMIAMDGVQVGQCDKSVAMLPNFRSNLTGQLYDASNIQSGELHDEKLANAFKNASFHRALAQAATRASVSRKHCQDELDRLIKNTVQINTNSIDRANPLRSELDAKRMQVELEKQAERLVDLEETLRKESARIVEASPIARENVLIDWMGWTNSKLSEVDAMDFENEIRKLFSNLAFEMIKPMTGPLTTTHAISSWSVGDTESNRASSDLRNGDLRNIDILDKARCSADFHFRSIKLRGRTLLGLEPLSMIGTLKRVESKKPGVSLQDLTTNIELYFDEQTSIFSSTTPKLNKTFFVTSTNDPLNKAHKIDVIHQVDHTLQGQELTIGPANFAHAHVQSVKPKSELRWSRHEDRWNCSFIMSCPDFKIELIRDEVATAKPQVLYHSCVEGSQENAPIFEVTYIGQLENERFDNCNETVMCNALQTMATSLKDYYKKQIQNDLVASKKYWVENCEKELALWQSSQASAIAEVRKNMAEFKLQITDHQKQLAEVLSDSREIRFSRKNSGEKSGTLTR